MPQSSNVLSFVPVPNLEARRSGTAPPHAKPEISGFEDEAVLRKIAEAALSATGAEGAALALRQEGAVVCVARAGEMAPPLGARLDDSSGMSGECLREGEALRCDDTETDARVDAEACRSLGLRSLAVAAVRDGDQVIGILEVFSPNPSTFTEKHLDVLRQLAELVGAEIEAKPADLESPPIAKSPPDASVVVPQPRLLPTKSPEEAAEALVVSSAVSSAVSSTASPALPADRPADKLERTLIAATPLPADVNISEYMAAHEKSRTQATPQRLPKIVLIGLATLLPTIALASFVGWYFGHRMPSQAAVAAPAPAASSPAPTAEAPPPATPDALPSPIVSVATDDPGRSKPAHDTVTNAAKRNVISDGSGDAKAIRVVQNPPAADADSDVAPGLAAGSGESKPSDTMASLLNTPVALPQRAPPVSQGVEGGELETQVAAIYPPQARAVGQHGTVVLEALVGENGSVRDVKVISGPPLLRQAATDAVRRWKYRPFKLNGKPIATPTQVQVEFKLQ